MEAASDSILFGMPEDPEMFLAALATVQDYVAQLKKQVKDRRKHGEWFVAVHLVKEFEFFKCCFPEEIVFVDEWNPVRGEWDYVYKFDAEVAYDLSLPTQQHVTTCFGILVGADPAMVPDLSAVEHEFYTGKEPMLQLLSFEGRDELAEIIDNHHPELGEALCGTSVVVGMRSFETYVAAALGKTVLELYPNDKHVKWLEKPGNYQMIVGDHFPVEFVWRALEGLLDRFPIMESDNVR